MTALEKAKEQAEKLLQEAALVDSIHEALPESIRGAKIYPCKLYGNVAHVKMGDSFGRVFGDARTMIEALPPVGLVQVRDGSLSHMPAPYVEALPEEKKQRWQEETQVSPLKLDVEHNSCELEWFADLPGVGLVWVSCIIARPAWLRVNWPRREFKGGFEYGKAQVSIVDYCSAYSPDGEALAQVNRPIKWWSSPEYPQKLTLTWCDIGEYAPLDVARAIVASL